MGGGKERLESLFLAAIDIGKKKEEKFSREGTMSSISAFGKAVPPSLPSLPFKG